MEGTPSDSPACVLLVDDNEANLTAALATLEPLGLAVACARSGEEALRRVLGRDFAVILMDVHLPGISGIEAARLIRRRERSRLTPIVFWSAERHDEVRVAQAYQEGGVDFLLKPYDPAALRAKVQALVRLHHEREQAMAAAASEVAARERQRADRETEARFRVLTDTMPQHVWALAPDGRVTFMNRTWCEYAGLGPDRRDPEDLQRALHPDDRERTRRAWGEALRTGEALQLEYRLRRALDGAWRWHLGRGQPVRDEDGTLRGWIATATDIDDQKRAQAALEEASRAKDEFLTLAAHELRTPLQAARAYLHLAGLRGGGDHTPQLGRALEGVARSVDRMARLVESLVDVRVLAEGRLVLECSRFGVADLAREVREGLAYQGDVERVRVDVPDDLCLTADRARVREVLSQLVTNALRFSPAGGPVTVRAEPTPDGVHLAVEDRGVGIAPEQLPHLFERYARAHDASFGGIGLGLSIVRTLVQAHGGRVWAESSGQEGEGSVFHVVLADAAPVAQAAGQRGR